jgi:ribosomal protein L24E
MKDETCQNCGKRIDAGDPHSLVHIEEYETWFCDAECLEKYMQASKDHQKEYTAGRQK